MDLTPVFGLPKPETSDAYDVALVDIPRQLADDVESTITGLGGIAAPGSWHTIGAGGEPAFGTNWAAWGSTHQVPQFRKIGTAVYLRGLLARSTTTSGTGSVVFTLPSGYRPPDELMFASIYSVALAPTLARINIINTGAVAVELPVAAGQFVSLSGIMFHID